MSSLLSSNNYSVENKNPPNKLIDPTLTMKAVSDASVSVGNAAAQAGKGASSLSGVLGLSGGNAPKNILFLVLVGFVAYKLWRKS